MPLPHSPVNPLCTHSDRWRPLAQRSVDLLREHQDPGGAWPASPGFAPYQLSWFRDGSFIADGASAAGLHDEAQRLHGWCAAVLQRERPAVERVLAMLAEGRQPAYSDYLPARHDLDGPRHDDGWWNFGRTSPTATFTAMQRTRSTAAASGRSSWPRCGIRLGPA